MILTLIQNVALVVMLASVQRFLSRRLDAYPRLVPFTAGILYGAAAVVGMMTPFEFAPGIIYDARSIIMSLAGLFGGPVAATVAASIAAAHRLALGGAGALAGVTTIIVSAGLGVALHRLRSRKPTSLRFAELLGFGLVVHAFMLLAQYLLIPGGIGDDAARTIGPVVLTLFPLGTALTARLMIEQQEWESAQVRLARDEERLRLAMVASDQAMWDYDVPSETVSIQAGGATIPGHGQGEIAFGLEGWLITMHVEDRERVEHALQALVSGEASEVNLQYRHPEPDGRERWILALGTAVEHDRSGRVVRALGVMADITTAKEAEAAALRRIEEAELLASASSRLITCSETAEVLDVIGEFFAKAFPHDIAVVNEMADDERSLEVHRIVGAETGMARRLLGRRFPLTPSYEEVLRSGRMQRIDGGLPALAGEGLPAEVTSWIAETFGIRDVWSVGITDRGKAYAGVHLLVRGASRAVPLRLIEVFAQLCFVRLARIEAVARLEESESRFRALVETAPDAILVHVDGLVAYVNDAACRLYGADDAGQLIGRPVMARIRPDYHAVVERRIRAIHDSGAPFGPEERVHLRLDGSEVYVEVSASPIVFRGQRGNLVFVRDITESKQTELELESYRSQLEELVADRTRELEAAYADLEKATRAKIEFLAKMSHELRTPLNSIIGFSTILGQGLVGPLDEEQARQIQAINTSGRHLQSVINNVLDFSRIEAARIEVEAQPVDLALLVAEAAGILQPLADEKGLELRVSCPGNLPAIASDAAKIRQILLNLGGNAIKFTETGHVEIALAISGPVAMFRITDTGPGIREELFEHIFEPFAQGEPPSGGLQSGTGLGLPICREFARLLGGEIMVSSVPGQGATFTFTMPVARSLPSPSCVGA
ncbi:MAG: PAS domain S-box protein [Coriobacteriia bacterium]